MAKKNNPNNIVQTVARKSKTPGEEINILKNVLDGKTEPTPVEPAAVVEPVVEPVTPVEPTPVEPVTPTPVEPVAAAPKVLSIFNDLKVATQEDKNLGNNTPGKDAFETLLEQSNNENKNPQQVVDEIARREGNKARASIVVEVFDVIMMLLCCLITWDFEDENQKKFTLHKDRKTAIQVNLFKIYELDKKRIPNPKKEITFLILGSYAPMLIVAVLIMINNFRKKAQAKKDKAALTVAQQTYAQEQTNEGFVIQEMREQNRIMAEEMQRLKAQQPVQQTNLVSVPSHGKAAPKKRGRKPGVKVGKYKKRY